MPGDYPPRAGKAVSGGHEDSNRAGPAVSGGRLRAGSRLALLLATSALAGPLLAFAARAETAIPGKAAAPVGTVEVMQLAMFVGVMGAALVSAIFLIRERARITRGA